MADVLNTGAHSVTFIISATDETEEIRYNTFETWGLVPATVPIVPPPSLKSKYVDLPASDGVLDYTELLLGKVPFGRRNGTWKFYTDLDKMTELGFTWDSLYSDLVSKLHSHEFKVMLTDDPDYYYSGRLGINEWRSSKSFSEITINFNFDSYKRTFTASDDNGDWDWDDHTVDNPSSEILYGNFSSGQGSVQELTYTARNYVYKSSQKATPDVWIEELPPGPGPTPPTPPTPTPSETLVIVVNMGEVIEKILGKDKRYYGATDLKIIQLLGNDGYPYPSLTFQVAKNTIASILGNSLPFPDVNQNPDFYTPEFQALLRTNAFADGNRFELQTGLNYNENLSLNYGDNFMLIIGKGKFHVRYEGVEL